MTSTVDRPWQEWPVGAVLGELRSTAARVGLLRPPRHPQDDLDLLVAAEELPRVLEAMRALGLVEEPAFGRGSHRFLVGLEELDFRRVDLQTSLCFGPLIAWESGMAETCLERSVDVGGARRLHPADEFWVTALHLLADDGTRIQDTERLAELAAAARRTLGAPENMQWYASLDGVLDPADLHARLAAEEGSREAASVLRTEVRRAFWATVLRRRSTAARWGRHGIERSSERIRQWRGRRGATVAVLGPDGAGKSTLIDSLTQIWPWPHTRVYFGLWSHRRDSAPHRAVRPALRPLRALGLYLVGLQASGRGRLVLFDRYTYDAAAPPHGRHLALKRVYLRILLHSVPAPDLVLLLDAPGDLAFARKGEMDPVTLDRNRLAVSDHVHRLSRRATRPRVVRIDASGSLEEVRAAALKAVWDVAAERLDQHRGRP